MADEPREAEGTWFVEPVAAGEVRVHFATGADVELSPEIRDALDVLLRELHAEEVEGYAVDCADLNACQNFMCTLGKCQPQSRGQCLWDEKCKIASFGFM